MRICDEGPAPFLPGEYSVRLATRPWERAGHFALRRSVFCEEQRIFQGSDRDALDERATLIVAMTCVLGSTDAVVGAVRIYEDAPGLWRGSRLAVHQEHRRVRGLGSELIRLAVCTAHARGASRFLAHIQAQNVPLFQRLSWRSLEQVTLHGLPHHLMEADLDAYPPHGLDETRLIAGAATPQRSAA